MAKVSIFLVGVMLLHCWVAMTDAEHLKYKDPKQPLNTRIKDLIKRMTLEEKIGQMVQIDRSAASADVINKYFIGSLLSGGGSVPKPQASAEDWVNMVNDFQKGALSTRLGIPMIYGIDAVHGHNNVYKATIFPHNVGLGATRDPALVKKIGEATALEVRATGIQYAFAPCIATRREYEQKVADEEAQQLRSFQVAVEAQSTFMHEVKEKAPLPLVKEEKSAGKKNPASLPLGMMIKVKPQAKKAKVDEAYAEEVSKAGIAPENLKRKSLEPVQSLNGEADKSREVALTGLVSYTDESDDDL